MRYVKKYITHNSNILIFVSNNLSSPSETVVTLIDRPLTQLDRDLHTMQVPAKVAPPTALLHLLLLLFAGGAREAAAARRSYAVMAPRAIRPNTNYFAAVSVDGTDGELQVCCV